MLPPALRAKSVRYYLAPKRIRLSTDHLATPGADNYDFICPHLQPIQVYLALVAGALLTKNWREGTRQPLVIVGYPEYSLLLRHF